MAGASAAGKRNLADGRPVYNVGVISGLRRWGSMINYFLLIVASVVGIVVFDEDPTGVSVQEWILFAVMAYSTAGLLRKVQEYLREHT
jgi:hypothetical protein